MLGFAPMIRTSLRAFFFFVLASSGVALAQTHPGEDALVREVVADTGQDATQLTKLLDGAQYKQSIIDAISRPAESKPWSAYRPIFVNPARIEGGIDFYRGNRALLERIGAEYHVPPQYLVAILGVETSYGQITGHYRVLDALATLAFYYPPRADYFRGELKTLLELPPSKLAGPVATLQGSYAGAQGWGQFMPSSIRDFAVDEDGDGHIDLNGSLPDILGSVANYFEQHGWQAGAPVAMAVTADAGADALAEYAGQPPTMPVEQFVAAGYTPQSAIGVGTPASLLALDGDTGREYWLTFNNFYVITRYNKSPRYAMAVTQLADAIVRGVAAEDAQATAAAAR